MGGQRAASAEELAALLAQAPAPGAPGSAAPALYSFDHVLGGGAGGARVQDEGLGINGTAQRTAVLYGTPAAPCFGRMLAALEAAARADEDRPGARKLTLFGKGMCRLQQACKKIPCVLCKLGRVDCCGRCTSPFMLCC